MNINEATLQVIPVPMNFPEYVTEVTWLSSSCSDTFIYKGYSS